MTQEALKLALEAMEVATTPLAKDRQKVLRAITAIKEALAQTQEPVAWVKEDVCDGQYIDGRPRKIWWECNKGVGTAFYTTPPQRTWVELSVFEITDLVDSIEYEEYQDLVKKTEAKLKQKNGYAEENT